MIYNMKNNEKDWKYVYNSFVDGKIRAKTYKKGLKIEKPWKKNGGKDNCRETKQSIRSS